MITRRNLFASLVLAVSCMASPAGAHHGQPACCPPPPPPKTVVLVVCHPCTDCKYEVPVCVPACCEGTPCVCFERTLIGAGRTVYEWSCGYRVIVRYHKDGGYRVVQR